LRKKGRAKSRLHAWERERERVVAAALNLGEMEMNGRERLYAREKERVPWEKRKSVMDAAAQHVWEKRKIEKDGPACV
jgi:hypothetical protein